MTTPADATADEQAFAACLAGRPVPHGAAGLAAFTHAVRAGATEPGRPNAALAELLATGLLVPTQEPSRGTAGRPARTSRKRPRMLITTLIAKFAAAGAVAKATAGAGVVAVALTGAATAGALPGQDTAVVDSDGSSVVLETPEEPAGEPVLDTSGPVDGGDDSADGTGDSPDGTGDGADATGDGGDGTGTGDEVVGEPPAEEPTASEVAEGRAPTDAEKAERHPDNHGGAVSSAAHERNAARKAAREDARAVPVAEQPETEDPAEVEAPAEAQPAPEQQASSGSSGDGNGKGKGDGGKGNGGK